MDTSRVKQMHGLKVRRRPRGTGSVLWLIASMVGLIACGLIYAPWAVIAGLLLGLGLLIFGDG